MASSPQHPAAPPEVLVVGGGPVGLVAAHLLGHAGVRVLLVERNASTSDDAKAISMDAETIRVLGLAGLAEQTEEIVAAGSGVVFYGRREQKLFHGKGPGPYVFGHAMRSQFSQPAFEAMLMEALAERPNVQVRMSTELVDLRQVPDGTGAAGGVVATIRGSGEAAGDVAERLSVQYVLGADGGQSTVRKLAGLPISGDSFPDVWLVVDTVDDPHDARHSMHVGDPRRPRVIVPGNDGRCRYEFLLRPGEGEAGEKPPFELVQQLLAPYRTITPEQIERRVNYRFHALVCGRWRDRRVLVLGDAAHMMPPFAGQGLNSGIRDAANLCWKVAAVIAGAARDELLDTYEAERKPHVTAVTKASVRQGRVMMTRSRAAATVRDIALRPVLALPPARRYLTQLRYIPRARYRAGFVAADVGDRNSRLLGSQLEQPWVQLPHGRRTRLDRIAGPGFALLGIDVSETDWKHVGDVLGAQSGLSYQPVGVVLGDRRPRSSPARPTIGDTDGDLAALLAPAAGKFVLLRPDRFVAAVFTAADTRAVANKFRPFLQP